MLKVSKKIKGTPSHTRSPRQEKELAKKVGGRVTPGSGNGVIKGDVRLNAVMRIECKVTKHDSFQVTREMINKIECAALPHGELPALVIELMGPPKMEVAVVPLYVLDMIRSARVTQ